MALWAVFFAVLGLGCSDGGRPQPSGAEGGEENGEGGRTTIGEAGGGTTSVSEPFDQPCGIEGCEVEAPALPQGVTTTVYDAIEFLTEHDPPLQSGLAPDALELGRAALLRGRVADRAGTPLPDVLITVANHPEYGRGRTLKDGTFNLGVNGGAPVTVNYRRPGFLPVQRTITPAVQSYAWFEDVVMLERSAPSNPLRSNAPEAQTARGAAEEDADGQRRATVIIPPGTFVTAVLPDGTRVPLPSANVRLQEYTVGDAGPSAMPGELPPTSGYTYAVDLSVDEAEALGAESVTFTQPVALYLENFLKFPAGQTVPVGFYVPKDASWVASNSGRIVTVLAPKGDLAELDFDGDGEAEDAEALAAERVTEAERRQVAKLYSAGTELWRVALAHFSSWDCNWPFGPPDDASAPDASLPGGSGPDTNCQGSGSIIHCESQVLGENLGVVGTPFALTYQSDRTPGYAERQSITLNLTDARPPAKLKAVEVEIQIAGQRHEQRYAARRNLTHEFRWDGLDAFGRRVQGVQTAKVRIGYAYDGVYNEGRQFAAPGGPPITGSVTRQEVALWQELSVPLGGWDNRGFGLGGFGLDVLHAYDTGEGILYLGDGTRRTAKRIAREVTALTNESVVGNPDGIAVDPAGKLVLTDDALRLVHRVDRGGNAERLAGNGEAGAPKSGKARATAFGAPQGVAVAPDGTVYVADFDEHVVVAIYASGTLDIVAGGGEPADFVGDGGPATEARLRGPDGLAVGPDGSVYIAEQIGHRVRRVDPSGVISTFAGGGSLTDDGVLATEANLNGPSGLAIASDGALFVSERYGERIRRIGPNGRITTIAGGIAGFSGDGGPARDARLSGPRGLAFALDGALFVADQENRRIRRIGTDGIITTAVGGGDVDVGRGATATNVRLGKPDGIAFGSDGTLYVASDGVVLRVAPELAKAGVDEIVLPSKDGQLVYVFDSRGRHLSTRDAFTAVPLLTFGYDRRSGALVSITDRDGLKTTIERSADGAPTAIVAPYGQRTELAVGEDGWLESLADPMGHRVTLEYEDGGLLTALVEPDGGRHEFAYDDSARLVRDTDPDGYRQVLSRHVVEGGYAVSLTTPLGRSTTYAVTEGPEGTIRTVTSATGKSAVARPIGATTTELTLADGTVVVHEAAPDPRWGMQASYAGRTVLKTPGGRTLESKVERRVVLADPEDPFSLTELEEVTTVGSRSWTTRYDAESRTWTSISPEGRSSSSTYDELGRLVLSESGGRAPIRYDYDEDGRLASITEGTGRAARVSEFTYGDDGAIASVRDALGREASFERDANGRAIALIRPDGERIAYGYDAVGRLLELTSAANATHAFRYTDSGLLSAYQPPRLGRTATNTGYRYNEDQQLTSVALPDGRSIELAYDESGRVTDVTVAAGTFTTRYRDSDGSVESTTAPDGSSIAVEADGSLPLVTRWSRETGETEATLSVTYDDELRVQSTLLNGTARVVTSYDGDGLLIVANGLTLTRDEQSGDVIASAVGRVTTSTTHDAFGQVTAMTGHLDDQTVLDQEYQLDVLGRIQSYSELNNRAETTEHQFEYDANGRLISARHGTAEPVVYSYDANGNRLSVSSGPAAGEIVYDEQDRLLQYGEWKYTRTENGDVLRRESATQAFEYHFDERGALESVTLPDARIVSYTYDAQGRRTGRLVDGVLQYELIYGSDLRPLAKLRPDGTLLYWYVYGTHVNSPDLIVDRNETYRVLHDHVGSVRRVVNVRTGYTEQWFDYDEFGRVTRSGGVDMVPCAFAGGLYDPDTKLVRFGAREYDPETGRFLTKDPSGLAGGLNLYEYAGGDPVNYIDPRGENPVLIWVARVLGEAAIGGAMGGAEALVWELIANGGNIDCVDWGAVSAGAIGGAVTGAITGAVGFGPLGKLGKTECPGVCPCFVAGTPVTTSAGDPVPIEAVALGQRVLPADDACDGADVSTWRRIELEMSGTAEHPDDHFVIALLRPQEWLDANTIRSGATTYLHFDELGVSGPAYVTAVGPGPPLDSHALANAGALLQSLPGCPVTGTIVHTGYDLVDVTFVGDSTPLRATPAHRLMTETRGWVAAGDLKVGERVVTRTGTAEVASLAPIAGAPASVFNLEIGGSHQYFVHELGVLAHNTYGAARGITAGSRVNMPAWKKVAIDMDEVASGHMVGGRRLAPGNKKDVFPVGMTESQVEKAVRDAYRHGEVLHSQGADRVFVRGPFGSGSIEMWVNKATKTIETAWPKF